MMIKILYPQITRVINNQANIINIIDEEGRQYKNLHEVIINNKTEDELIIYSFFYPVIYCQLEEMNFEKVVFKKPSTSVYYKKWNYYIVASTFPNGDFKREYVPRIQATRGRYEGVKFRMNDIKNFLRNINEFNIKENEIIPTLQEAYEMMDLICDKLRYKNEIPKSIQQLARKTFGEIAINEDRLDYQTNIRSSYMGGVYYIQEELNMYEDVYNYDKRSMYPYILNNYKFPDPQSNPIFIDDFIKVDNDYDLAFYHIKSIKAEPKEKHFPFLWIQEGSQAVLAMKKFGYLTPTTGAAYYQDLTLDLGWITSIDYDLLMEHYDIEQLEIDYTYYISDLISGNEYFSKLREYYDKKEKATGTEKIIYKLLINSYTGSLAMKSKSSYYVKYITKQSDEPKKLLPNELSKAPCDIAAFMNAYARKIIYDLAMKAGYDNVISIDTDGIFTKNRILDKYCGEGMGSLRLDHYYKKAQWFGKRCYEFQEEDGNWSCHIAGLPNYLYVHDEYKYRIPQLKYNNVYKQYEYVEMPYILENRKFWEEEAKKYEK